jgi:SAM-dependent methyltransferase
MQKPYYSVRFYQGISSDSAISAKAVAPLIVRLFAPGSFVDVGCGTGTWTRALKDAGVPAALGIDGHNVQDRQLVIPRAEFQRHDLTQVLRLDRRFDLALSLEVAEHLPPERAGGFVADLCRLSDVVVFSAAVPGQGGTHHVNEQWPSYWIALFESCGYTVVDCLRPQLWYNTDVAWWYRQNMLTFIKHEELAKYPAAVELGRQPFPPDVVHPQAYVTAALPREMSPRMIRNVIQAIPHFPGKLLRHLRKMRHGKPGSTLTANRDGRGER